MKKEQIQRFALLSVLILMGLYFFVDFMLGPLAKREKKAKTAITKLEPLIEEAKTRIRRYQTIKASDQNAEAAAAIFELLKKEIPNEAAVAWFPLRMGEHFKAFGLERPAMQNTAFAPDPGTPGYHSSTWTLTFSTVPFLSFAEALAALENKEGMLQVSSVRIDSSPSDPERQKVFMEVTTIVKP